MSDQTTYSNTTPTNWATIPSNAQTFIDGVLTGIGAPLNNETREAMYDWLANEQGGPGLPDFNQNQGNPLGVQSPGGELSGTTGSVQGGVNATVANLLAGNYNNLVAAFRAGKSTLGIDEQIVASPWNGSHYGGTGTFLTTAGVPKSDVSGATFLPLAPPGATNEQVVAANAPSAGCNAKGNVFGEGGVLGIGSFSFTYCELKALTGGFLMIAGGFLMVVGAATLVLGGLGTKSGGVAAPVVGIAAGVTRVRSVRKTLTPRRKAKPKEAPKTEPAAA